MTFSLKYHTQNANALVHSIHPIYLVPISSAVVQTTMPLLGRGEAALASDSFPISEKYVRKWHHDDS